MKGPTQKLLFQWAYGNVHDSVSNELSGQLDDIGPRFTPE